MNRLDDLNRIIDNNLTSIVVTNSMKKQILSNTQHNYKNRVKRWLIPAACITALLLVVISGNSNSIVKAVQPIFKYIPGINSLITVSDDDDSYALDGCISIKTATGNHYIDVLSSFTDGNIVKTVLRSNIPVEAGTNKLVALAEDQSSAKIIESNIMSDGKVGSSDYEWIGNVNFEFSRPVSKFSLKLEAFNIPIIMSKIAENGDLKEYKNTAYTNGIRVAALTQYKDTLLEVKIVGLSDDGKKIVDFSAGGDLYAVDKDGKCYKPVLPPSDKVNPALSNTFYFDARLKADLKIVIPYIILAGNEKTEIKFSPDTDDKYIALPFNNGSYTAKIVKWQRIDNKGHFTYRQMDSKDRKNIDFCQSAIEMVIDKNFDFNRNDALFDFDYSCNSSNSCAITSTVDGKKVYYMGYGGSPSLAEQFNEPRYKTILVPDLSEDQKAIDITFFDPLYYQKGPWTISLQK